jgi:hypothetical protein
MTDAFVLDVSQKIVDCGVQKPAISYPRVFHRYVT